VGLMLLFRGSLATLLAGGRAANESSRAELGLTQARLMKIRVESSRARETVRAEKSSSNSARYYSS
jgi:hypothetical protein